MATLLGSKVVVMVMSMGATPLCSRLSLYCILCYSLSPGGHTPTKSPKRYFYSQRESLQRQNITFQTPSPSKLPPTHPSPAVLRTLFQGDMISPSTTSTPSNHPEESPSAPIPPSSESPLHTPIKSSTRDCLHGLVDSVDRAMMREYYGSPYRGALPTTPIRSILKTPERGPTPSRSAEKKSVSFFDDGEDATMMAVSCCTPVKTSFTGLVQREI